MGGLGSFGRSSPAGSGAGDVVRLRQRSTARRARAQCTASWGARGAAFVGRVKPVGALRERHFFHWRHRRLFPPLAAAAACAAAILALIMPSAVREPGSVLRGGGGLLFGAFMRGDAGCREGHAHFPGRRSRRVAGCGVVHRGLRFCLRSQRFALPGRRSFLRGSGFRRSILRRLRGSIAVRSPDGNPTGNSGSAGSVPIRWRLLGRVQGSDESLCGSADCILQGCCWPYASTRHPRSAALIFAGLVSALLLALLDRMRKRMTPLALRAAADLVLLTPLLLFLR